MFIIEPNIQKIRDVENKLRKLIISTLIIDFGYSKDLFPEEILRLAISRKKKRETKLKSIDSESSELVDYFNFGDYYKIITFGKNWERFFSRIFLDEKILYTKLKELEEFRNDLAHHRKINTEQSTILNANAKYIITCIWENMFNVIDIFDGIKNNNLLESYKNRANILEKLLKIIAEANEPSLVSIERADVLACLKNIKKIITAEHSIELKNSLKQIDKILINYDFTQIKKGIFFIEGPNSLTLEEINRLGEKAVEKLPKDCELLWGAKIDKKVNKIIFQIVYFE